MSLLKRKSTVKLAKPKKKSNERPDHHDAETMTNTYCKTTINRTVKPINPMIQMEEEHNAMVQKLKVVITVSESRQADISPAEMWKKLFGREPPKDFTEGRQPAVDNTPIYKFPVLNKNNDDKKEESVADNNQIDDDDNKEHFAPDNDNINQQIDIVGNSDDKSTITDQEIHKKGNEIDMAISEDNTYDNNKTDTTSPKYLPKSPDYFPDSRILQSSVNGSLTPDSFYEGDDLTVGQQMEIGKPLQDCDVEKSDVNISGMDLENTGLDAGDVVGNMDIEDSGQGNSPTQDLACFMSQTPVLSFDVECVGGDHVSLPAKVAVCNQFGNIIYETHIQPVKVVKDFRTKWSGIRPSDLFGAPPLCEVLSDLRKLFIGSIVVGHATRNDLRYLGIQLDSSYDTQMIDEYRALQNHVPALKFLVKKYYNMDIQSGAHDCSIDAYYTMALFKRVMFKMKLQPVGSITSDGSMVCPCGRCVPFVEKKKCKFKTNLFHQLHNYVKGHLAKHELLKNFSFERKANSPAWRKFIQVVRSSDHSSLYNNLASKNEKDEVQNVINLVTGSMA